MICQKYFLVSLLRFDSPCWWSFSPGPQREKSTNQKSGCVSPKGDKDPCCSVPDESLINAKMQFRGQLGATPPSIAFLSDEALSAHNIPRGVGK